jgi:hypothetical protein
VVLGRESMRDFGRDPEYGRLNVPEYWIVRVLHLQKLEIRVVVQGVLRAYSYFKIISAFRRR